MQFLGFIAPLVAVQIYYAKRKDERHLLNDIAGILTFGVIGMASFYLTTTQYHWSILLHPTLFFIATTLYVKSVARERKKPLYLKWSILSHSVLGILYLAFGELSIGFSYVVGLARAMLVPKQKWSIKQIGIAEFGVVLVFLLALYWH